LTARLAPGDAVRVRAGAKLGHVRTPGYLKGKRERLYADVFEHWLEPGAET
jgi:hypothetical protein